MNRCAPESGDFREYGELVIEPGWPAVLYFNVFYDEQASFGFCELSLAYTKMAQPFGAGTLEVSKIVGVINHAARVSILIIYANT